ncbi:MAG: enoyl-CoA hydratase-related protein [Polyangiales bacterium]
MTAVTSESRPYRTLLVQTEGGVTSITLNRPERRNAIGPEMINELRWALADADADGAVRVVVLTGAGKAFCAGGDFAQMTGGADQEGIPLHPDGGGDYAALLLAMMKYGKPIVAKVNGHAMGGGLGLVAASTFAIASIEAQLGTPEVDVGLFPMMIMAVLARLVPRRKLVSMMLLGERLDAHDAAEIGLINDTAAPEEMDGKLGALVDRLKKKAPLAVRHGLEALHAQDTQVLADALPMLRDRLGALLATDDAREGLMAFMQKRPPVWQNR